ncbi:MAG TPA: tRNA guanosine(34) transglycosylase Tgt [Phycisphaerales bacterium]|nr:tRNA guanosine(34) transglycosylase Tgt [Phycisphaerales bacterium]
MPIPLRYEPVASSRTTLARLGRVHTPHGAFDTPAFMPVGTRGTVKGVLPDMLAATGAQICLANTYHLMLRPGADLVERVGGKEGVHALMNWRGPILTDSGGYQAFSMADLNTLSDEGVTFKSIVDGSSIHLSPERAVHVQNQLGADIIMAFDDCPPSASAGSEEADPDDARLARALSRDKVTTAADYTRRVRTANERTARWLERCWAAHQRKHDQALFGIVQGGTLLDQRTWSAQALTQLDLPGFAIGGVAVGETFQQIMAVVRHTAPLLPHDKPRYLMGVGYERDLLGAALAGVDMFDCVLPTRNARNANAFTPVGQLRVRNAKHAEDTRAIWPGSDDGAIAPCDCYTCRPPGGAPPFSRAYLRHLFMAGEMLGPMLVSLHNLRHFQRFMADLRATILTDRWASFAARWPVAAEGLPPTALHAARTKTE